LSSARLPRLRNFSDQQKQTIDEIKGKLGVSEEALKGFFTTIGQNDVPPDQLAKKLVEIAENYKQTLVQAAPNPNDAPEIAKVKDAIKTALEAGQLGSAKHLLEQLGKLQDAAIVSGQLERAGTSAQRGRLEMSQLRYQDAAQHFAEAASRVPTERADVRLSYLREQAAALYQQGDERGDNTALANSISIWKNTLLEDPPRAHVARLGADAAQHCPRTLGAGLA
jgi:tetratricopeptide (TPR) repeat protein